MSRARVHPEGSTSADRRTASDAARIAAGGERLPGGTLRPEAATALRQLAVVHGSKMAAIEAALLDSAALIAAAARQPPPS